MYIDRMKRGTGRTHNMIVAAIAHAREYGESVIVMCNGNDMECSINHFTATDTYSNIVRDCEVKISRTGYNVKINIRNRRTNETCKVTFISSGHTNIEWYQFRVIGVEQKSTFFDHHAIESRFAELLDRWTRYDNKLSNLNAAHAQRHFENEQ